MCVGDGLSLSSSPRDRFRPYPSFILDADQVVNGIVVPGGGFVGWAVGFWASWADWTGPRRLERTFGPARSTPGVSHWFPGRGGVRSPFRERSNES